MFYVPSNLSDYVSSTCPLCRPSLFILSGLSMACKVLQIWLLQPMSVNITDKSTLTRSKATAASYIYPTAIVVKSLLLCKDFLKTTASTPWS